MDFKIGSKVFYPSHGAGWIREEKEIEFDGTKKKYYEFELITNPLRISAPVDRVEELGIRKVLNKKEILEKISILKKTPTKKTKTDDFNAVLNMFKELAEEPSFDSSLEIIQFCNYIKKKREKEGRLIPVSIEKQLEEAYKNLVGELAVSGGTSLKGASKSFSKATGLDVELED